MFSQSCPLRRPTMTWWSGHALFNQSSSPPRLCYSRVERGMFCSVSPVPSGDQSWLGGAAMLCSISPVRLPASVIAGWSGHVLFRQSCPLVHTGRARRITNALFGWNHLKPVPINSYDNVKCKKKLDVSENYFHFFLRQSPQNELCFCGLS